MHIIDWIIVAIPMIFIVGVAFYSKRYTRGAADYLAAGRVAGRYVLCVGDMMAALSIITLVAVSEQCYQTGFGVGFWGGLTAPVGLVLALTGYVTYRWRKTRCLSKGQFIELRYGSKVFRIVTSFVSTLSEALTNALGPAIAANFFIYYVGLPHKVEILGFNVPMYFLIVLLCITLAMLIIWPGGRISLLVTDCFQGIISYPIFVAIFIFVAWKLSWNDDVVPVLLNRVPNQSFLDPYDVSEMRDFNVFAIVVGLVNSIMNRGSWIGNDNSGSGRNAHEQKMSGVLGYWRNAFSAMLPLLLVLLTYVFMNSAHFSTNSAENPFKMNNYELRQKLTARVLEEVVEEPALRNRTIESVATIKPMERLPGSENAKLAQLDNYDSLYFQRVRESLGDTPEARANFQRYRTLYYQMMMPVTVGKVFPVGLMGVFCALMLMLLISTDDSRIFNAAGCLVQDLILPLMKTRLSPEKHLKLLRWTSLGVAVFFLFAALLFSQMDYLNMVMTILTAIWLGGAGPIMIFGLYTHFGNIYGAWASLIFGSGTAVLGMTLQNNWAKTVYPFLERHNLVDTCDKILRTLSSPFDPWIRWQMDKVKFPINSYEILFIAIMLGILGYIVLSLLTYKRFDLESLFYEDDSPAPVEQKKQNIIIRIINSMVGITAEYTRGDRIIAWSVFFYSFVYSCIIMVVGVIIWNTFSPWTINMWVYRMAIASFIVPAIAGVISTVWFMWGGTRDAIQLFRDLAKRVENPEDNGQVLHTEEKK